jgi:hypothetical protein
VASEPPNTAKDRLTDERQRIVMWRMAVLVKAGYSLQLAETLAERDDVDLHRAVELVDQGCPTAVAALILL